jgi:hypothetical protein
VKSISQSRTEQDVPYDRIVLSAGSADGVRAEMKFWLHRPRRRTFEYLPPIQFPLVMYIT